MDFETLLVSTIDDYNNGGLENEEFVKKAHEIYNSYANYSCSLPRTQYPYLLGVMFAGFAKYYKGNIDYYTSIMENALYCFAKCMKVSDSLSERQCAAMRLLFLIDDNDRVMKGIAHNFFEKRCQELYGSPLIVQQILANGMDPWTFETDILVNIGNYCIEQSDAESVHSCISSTEMDNFEKLKKMGKYNVRFPLVQVSPKQVFELFFDFILEYVSTPYERRVTMLRYGW